MIKDGVLTAVAATQSMSAPAAWQFVATDMNDIVHTVAGSGRPNRSGNAVLSLEMSSGLQRIRCDQERLADVLSALLFRAERSIANAARTAGMIRIRTWATEDDVRLRLSTDGLDDSAGDMTATDLGLSLTECAEIISDHGGRMVFWRPFAGESSYTIILPAVPSHC